MIRLAFAPPRNPLARIALGLGGLAILALLSVFGLALAALITAAVAGRAIWLRVRNGAQATVGQHDPLVIDGEFKVVEPTRFPPQR